MEFSFHFLHLWKEILLFNSPFRFSVFVYLLLGGDRRDFSNLFKKHYISDSFFFLPII